MIDMTTASFGHLFINFILSVGVGLTIGIERTISITDARRAAGLRDFILIAVLSFVSSLFYSQVPLAWIISFVTIIFFTLSMFLIRNIKITEKTIALTTHLALPITFLIAALPNFGAPLWITATIVFGMLMVLGLKVRIHQFGKSIVMHEVIDFAILLAIAISITPLIPESARIPIPLVDFVDGATVVTYQPIYVAALWKVVVMVSLMSFAAHFVTKYLTGRNALLIATFSGGLISSLATIMMLLRNNQSTKSGGTTSMLSREEIFLGYVSANAGSIFRAIIILKLAVSEAMFRQFMFPLTATFVAFAAMTAYAFYSQREDEDDEEQIIRITKRPLPLMFIFKFSGMVAGLIIAMTLVTHYLGMQAFVLASFFSGVISSAAAITSVSAAMMQDNLVFGWTAGMAILASLLGSIFAKYVVITKKLGAKAAMPFLLPIVVLAVVGFTTLWISLNTGI